MDDVLDDALDFMADAGPEYDVFDSGFFLGNHGPMVVEALCSLGRPDVVVTWTERYRTRLDARPPRRGRIDHEDWVNALGDMARVSDWFDLFNADLGEAAWTEVVDLWVPRLAPGMIGGLHGAIRTAHAVRSIGRTETVSRRRELADGLAYWAASFKGLPAPMGTNGELLPSQAICEMTQLDIADRTGWLAFTEPIGKLAELPSFAASAGLVDLDRDSSAVVGDLARTFAAILLANNAVVNPRALCHGLTGGTVLRLMAPHLSRGAAHVLLRSSWQTAAAFYCAIVLEPPNDRVEKGSPDVQEIIDAAIDCPDEHAVKVVEACLREYAENPDPVFLAAAADTTKRLFEVGIDLY